MAAAVEEIERASIQDARHILLRSIAEQLKMPMLYIARQAELSQAEETIPATTFSSMQANAEMALRLIDCYILGLELAEKQMTLELEPVPISAVLYDIAHDLTPLARQRNTEIELVLEGRYGQVMAHSQGLTAALYSLGSVLSEVCAERTEKATLHIGAHRSGGGVAIGMYTEGIESVQTTMYRARRLRQSFARQPFMKLCSGSGAGIFIADTILASMDSQLRAGRLHGRNGLAATLQQSKQMQLV